MKVYAYFDADAPSAKHDADYLRLWERSWRRMGWEPKILTALNAQQSKFFAEGLGINRGLAYHSTGGGAWYSDDRVINFGFKPQRPERLFYHAPGVFWVAPKRMDDWWRMKLAGQQLLTAMRPFIKCTELLHFSGSVDTQDVINCGQTLY